MSTLLIANLFSFVSACFTIAACWTKDPHRTYWYQVGQCLVYAIATYFFGVYANVLVMLISAFRNGLIAAEKYSKSWMIICTAASTIMGLAINHGSIPGYITIFATFYFTIASFYLKEAKAVKLNVAIDLSLWTIADLLVFDVPSGIVDSVSVALALITIWRIWRGEKKASSLSDEKVVTNFSNAEEK